MRRMYACLAGYWFGTIRSKQGCQLSLSQLHSEGIYLFSALPQDPKHFSIANSEDNQAFMLLESRVSDVRLHEGTYSP